MAINIYVGLYTFHTFAASPVVFLFFFCETCKHNLCLQVSDPRPNLFEVPAFRLSVLAPARPEATNAPPWSAQRLLGPNDDDATVGAMKVWGGPRADTGESRRIQSAGVRFLRCFGWWVFKV